MTFRLEGGQNVTTPGVKCLRLKNNFFEPLCTRTRAGSELVSTLALPSEQRRRINVSVINVYSDGRLGCNKPEKAPILDSSIIITVTPVYKFLILKATMLPLPTWTSILYCHPFNGRV